MLPIYDLTFLTSQLRGGVVKLGPPAEGTGNTGSREQHEARMETSTHAAEASALSHNLASEKTILRYIFSANPKELGYLNIGAWGYGTQEAI